MSDFKERKEEREACSYSSIHGGGDIAFIYCIKQTKHRIESWNFQKPNHKPLLNYIHKSLSLFLSLSQYSSI